MKKLLKTIGILILAILVLAAGFIGYLTIREFNPADVQAAERMTLPDGLETLSTGEPISVLSWNIGYCGLDQTADFFMDGGSMVYPTSQEAVAANLAAVKSYLNDCDAQIIFLQEVDIDSARSGHRNEVEVLAGLGYGTAFAPNYRCDFVPFPLPPIGKVDSGVMTLFGNTAWTNAQRISLPCPFSWPVSAANLKRCLLVTRFPLDSGKELVSVNLHLEAYDDGEGKAAQTQFLMGFLEDEYAKGNYVLAGGDFNQTFPGAQDAYPMQGEDLWTPGTLETDALSTGWSYAYDISHPTCRSLDRPLDAADPTMQYYVIDGFLVSPNITVNSVAVQDLGFANSDHNPVALSITLD